MSFLSPLFLAGAAAAVVPIVLHLFRRRVAHRVRFAAVALLQDAPVEQSAHRRLRQWLLLALRVAALVLLALAFARPFFRAASASTGRLTVVAIDTSLSISAPTQLTEARRRAREAIRAAAGEVAVVTFSDSAAVVVPPTSSKSTATSVGDATTPGFQSTSYRAAFAAAADLFRGRSGKIVVVTDLQANGWDSGARALVPPGVQVELQDLPALSENLAIIDLRGDGDRVVATVANASAQPKEVPVTLSVDGRPAGRVVIQVGAHDAADAAFGGIRSGAVAQAVVDDPRGIPGDNSRLAFLPGVAPASVLVVTTSGDLDKDAWYVRNALIAATPSQRSGDVTGVSAAQLAAWTGNRLSRLAAVVVVSSRGLERRAREQLAAYVSAGGGLLVAAGPDVDGEVISDVLGAGGPLDIKPSASETLALAPADVRHPIFRTFGGDIASLSLVRFRNAARVSASNCQTIARFTSGDAAVLDCAVGSGHAVIVASDLNNRWNDFPIRASFVPFLDQTVRYLSNNRTRGAEYLVDDVPSGVPPVPGVITVNGPTGQQRAIVNVNPRESDLDRMSASDFHAFVEHLKDSGATDTRAELGEHESGQHLWRYLMAAAVVALFAEGIVAARAV
jgi:hypothetical protein